MCSFNKAYTCSLSCKAKHPLLSSHYSYPVLAFHSLQVSCFYHLPLQQLAQPGALQSAGLEQSEASLRFLWDNHFAAIACDNPPFEAYPPAPAADGKPGSMMHETIIGLWGMPIGEMFQLDALAEACAADKRYEFFFTSAPLNKLGGVASPPNALAIR